jgi:uncharacterized membrane protein (DUF2068 family)
MIRPKIISFICVIGFITVIFSFPQVFSPLIKKLGMFTPALYGAIIAFQFISYVGLWHLKQWGARLFVLSGFARIFFNVLFFDSLGFGFFLFLVVLVFSIVYILKYYRQMNPNF